MSVDRSSDAAIKRIAELLPDRWVLQSVQINELDDYSVLLCPRGPLAPGEFGRIFGTGPTIAEALNDSVTKLEAWLKERTSESPAACCRPTTIYGTHQGPYLSVR